MSISQATIQAVQDSVHIEEVIADFLPLKKKDRICGHAVLFTKKKPLPFLYHLPKASTNASDVMLLAMPSPLCGKWKESAL